MSTTFMNLDLPIPTVTLGPAWATQLNAQIEVIDSHDHTSGKGSRIPTSGLNINADLDFNEFGALNLRIASFDAQTSTPSGSSFAQALSVFSGNLYYTNNSGVAIQLTDGGAIVSNPGSAQVFETTSINTNLTISPSDTFVYIIVDTSAARTINLPAASAVSNGRIFVIKDASGLSNTNNITLNADGSDQIDGAGSLALDSNYGSSIIVSDGTSNWYRS